MNELTTNVATMTSLEIAELVESRHDNVRVAIERLSARGVISQPAMQDGEKSANGVVIRVYVFEGAQGRRDSTIVVAQLSPEFTARLVDRWQELEGQVAEAAKIAADPLRVLNDPAAMRGLLLTYSERLIASEDKVAKLAPKAEALDRIADADGAMCMTNAAKHLQVQPKRLIDWLRANRWIYRRAGGASLVAYQDKIQFGYMTHKITTVTRADGSEKMVEQALITARGLVKLSKEINAEPEPFAKIFAEAAEGTTA